MSLAELIPLEYSFDFGGAQLKLRYDMAALLGLEREGLDYSVILGESVKGVTVLQFLHAGLVEDIGKEREVGIISTLGIDEVWEHCRAAVLLSLPEYDPLEIPDTTQKRGEKPDYKRLHTLICDVMRKPEEFFWHSTLRELLSRWQDYSVCKGYSKPPERMELYDTEGID